ncbi:radical SAM protein [Stenotrophomonas sp.]|uniref:radical SAM protein n=1 Tax=Stenotrophomonas sp. TaxID=69392 RepID=UPI0029B2FD7E|nr:radical SAM protein [Stenotrophomonas sp.]MDX3935732.1 radical SAM protein [Stenotrophomonas sp.]
MRINALYVIIKLVERCNLKCSYCYYYTDENAEVYQRATLMPDGLLVDLIGYIREALASAPVRRVVFGFHGGEPTLAKASRVRAFCEQARQDLEGQVEVGFALQTNGVHMSREWLSLIVEQRMGVGISIDGDRQLHDTHRVDHAGKGSYDRVRHTLDTLLPLERAGHVRVTALTVMGETFDGVAQYRHMVDTLGLNHIKLLFVDRTADMPPGAPVLDKLASDLCDMFDHWLLHDRNRVDVSLFTSTVRALLAVEHGLRGARDRITMGFALLSDGRVRIQDDFMIASDWFWSQQELNVVDTAFKDYVQQPHLQQLVHELIHVPDACQDCEFSDVCAGGEPAHRYTRARGFDNRSVYCDALMRFHRHVQTRLAAGSRALPAALPSTLAAGVA